jgi:hypothetical protein
MKPNERSAYRGAVLLLTSMQMPLSQAVRHLVIRPCEDWEIRLGLVVKLKEVQMRLGGSGRKLGSAAGGPLYELEGSP